MSGYIAKRRTKALKHNYLPGDTIAQDAIPADLAALLIDKGFIIAVEDNENTAVGALAPTPTPTPEPVMVKVPINTPDGVLELELKPEEIAHAVSILQLNAENASAEIAAFDGGEELLILIDAIDSRKTVKSAVRSKSTAKKEGGDEAEGNGSGGA